MRRTSPRTGRPLRRGVVYRSNELQLTDADAATLARLGDHRRLRPARRTTRSRRTPTSTCRARPGRHVEVGGIPMDAVEPTCTTGRRPHDVMRRRLPRLRRGRPRRARGVRDAAAATSPTATGAAAVPLHGRQGPHRLGGGAAAAPRRRRRRDDPRGLPAHQHLLVGHPGEVPRHGPRAPRRGQGRRSTSWR